MDDYYKYKKIATLIVKELSGSLNPEEAEVLTKWKNQNYRNKALYRRIRNSGNYRASGQVREQVDIQAGWNKVSVLIVKHKNDFRRKVLAYAAISIVLLALGGRILYNSRPRPVVPDESSQLAAIKPGRTQATLTLASGQVVRLNAGKGINITEQDGTKIRKSNNGINYYNTQKVRKDQLLNNVLTTPRGGEYHLTLSDGTRVFLNAMSRLKYPVRFTGRERTVELEGEAYFEVTKDPEKPFHVKTGQLNVTVLGTAFNINTYDNPGQVVTTLVRGTVKLSSANRSFSDQVLSPNEQACFDINKQKIKIGKVDVNLYTAWKDGQFVFYDQRLADIMGILTKWYSANISFTSPAVENLRFSGSLDRYGDIDQILEIIQETNKVTIKIEGKNISFSPKK